MLFLYTHSFSVPNLKIAGEAVEQVHYESFVGVSDALGGRRALEKGFRTICESRNLCIPRCPDTPIDIENIYGFVYQNRVFDKESQQKIIRYIWEKSDTTRIDVKIIVHPSSGDAYVLFDNMYPRTSATTKGIEK